MATENGRKQAKIKRDKPIIAGSSGNTGSGGQIDNGRAEQTISNLETGLSQFIEEVNEAAFQISKAAMVLQTKCRGYAQELERIKQEK